MRKSIKKSVAVLLAASTFLMGCTATAPAADEETTTEETTAEETTAEETTEKEEGEVTTISVVLPGDSTEEAFYREQLDIFEAENPDIVVDLMYTPNDADSYGTAVSLMYSSGEAPDILRVSASFPTSMMTSYGKGWLAPLDDYLTDEYMAMFPDGAFEQSGGLMIDGEIYGIPFIAAEYPAFRPMIYNMDILNEYGFEETPKDWDELKEMCEVIKEESGGKVYGFATNGMSSQANGIDSFSETIASTVVDLNVTEGIFKYDATTGYSAAANEGSIASVEFYKELNDENLMLPGWEACDGAAMIQYMASGNVAMISGMSYWTAEILAINPDINIEISSPIPRTEEDDGNRYIYAACDPYYGISSQCENMDEAWRVMEFISGLEFQYAFYELTGRVPYGYNSYEDGTLADYMVTNMACADEFLNVAPNPGNYHEDANTLIANILANAPTPSLLDIYYLAIVNGDSYEELAKEYDIAMDAVVDEQIQLLQDEGSDITREDLIFPDDWDSTVDYTN